MLDYYPLIALFADTDQSEQILRVIRLYSVTVSGKWILIFVTFLSFALYTLVEYMSSKNQLFTLAVITAWVFIFIFTINGAYAREETNWVRGPAEIVKGFYESKNEIPICGGVGVWHVSNLTESTYSSSRIQYYDICSGYYDMDSTINFSSPPEKISAGSTAQLKASGSKSGDQACCFIYDWFYYDGTCASLGSDHEVFLNLRELSPDSIITLPNGKTTTGYSGTVTDEIDVALTMPENGTECTVTGHASDGLWLKWSYQLVTEVISDVEISDILGGEEPFQCKDNEVNDFIIILKNNGSTVDTGTIDLYTDLKGGSFVKSKINYSLDGNEVKAYPFGMVFPSSMSSSDGNIVAHLSSDNGINISMMKIEVGVNCSKYNYVSHLLLYILSRGVGAKPH